METTKISFKEELYNIIEEHKLYNYNQFNIFKVMFKLHDEKYLHSRFIAFLLDPNGSHRHGTIFLEMFLQVMGLSHFSLDGVLVNPNEVSRNEVHDIDILIRNNKKQAIIIENKVFAKDQTKDDERDPDLKYQLPRYYYKLMKEDNYEVMAMIYLTINGKNPEDYDKFPEKVKRLLIKKDHLSDIAEWLDLCLAQLQDDSDLKRSIEQYLQARFEFLNDVQLALRLKDLTVTHYDEAKIFWFEKSNDFTMQIVQNQFKHVKWHTLHEFYSILKHQIRDLFGVSFIEIDEESITKLTHNNKKIRTSLKFQLNRELYYICNDINGFSIGRHAENKSKNDFRLLFDKDYAWFDFTNGHVFDLIDPRKSQKLVDEVITELKNFINN